jgi:hypothetical protein
MPYDAEQVRQAVIKGNIYGTQAPWPWGVLEPEIEFWQIAQSLDNGTLLAQRGLTQYAAERLAWLTAYRDNGHAPGNAPLAPGAWHG